MRGGTFAGRGLGRGDVVVFTGMGDTDGGGLGPGKEGHVCSERRVLTGVWWDEWTMIGRFP